MNDSHHIFLSYSRTDTRIMKRIEDTLHSHQFTVWTDEGLEPGTSDWKKEIEKAILASGCLVALMSPDARESRWVREEISFAEAHSKRVFILLVRGNTKSSLPFGYTDAQHVDIRQEDQYDTGIASLSKAIKKHLNLPLKILSAPVRTSTDVPLPTGLKTPLPRPQTSAVRALPPPPKTTVREILQPIPQAPFRKLTPSNPSDQFRMLWWLCVKPSGNPSRYGEYQKYYGKDALHTMGNWLLSTMIWSPFLIAAIGLSFDLAPLNQWVTNTSFAQVWLEEWKILIFPLVIAAYFGCIFLFKNNPGGLVFVLTMLVVGMTTMIVRVNPVSDIVLAVAVVIGVGIASQKRDSTIKILLGVMMGMSGIYAATWFVPLPVYPEANGLELTTIVPTTIRLMIGGAVGCILGTLLAAGVEKVIYKDFEKEGYESRFVLIFLMIFYLALIWVYWLGGWQRLPLFT